MSEREELEPITDEAQLRVGDLVVLRQCRYCSGSHRFMLLRKDKRLGRSRFPEVDGMGVFLGAWEHAPAFHDCGRSHLKETAAEGRLFRVRNVRDDEDSQETERLLDEGKATARALRRELLR